MFTPLVTIFLANNRFQLVAGTFAFSIANQTAETPIELAAIQLQWQVMLEMAAYIQYFDNIDDSTKTGHAVHIAAEHGVRLYELLRIKNINPTWHNLNGDRIGYGALHHAIANGDLISAKQLITYGFDVNQRFTIDGITYPSPLEVAMKSNYWNGILFLASHKADLTTQDKFGLTAIGLAAKHSQWPLVVYLAKSIQKTENLGDLSAVGSVVNYAVIHHQPLNELLKIKHINKTWHDVDGDKIGYGALHHAVADRNLVAVGQLITYGFDVNQQFTIDGITYPSPLGLAIENRYQTAFDLLVQKKASVKTFLLMNQSYQINSMLDDIVKYALDIFNKTSKKPYRLKDPIKNQLKQSILDSLVENKAFLDKFIFQKHLANQEGKALLIKGLARYVALNIMQPKYTGWTHYFRDRKIKLSVPAIPQTEIDDYVKVPESSLGRVMTTVIQRNPPALEHKEGRHVMDPVSLYVPDPRVGGDQHLIEIDPDPQSLYGFR
jgi:ankyrin repeat protein